MSNDSSLTHSEFVRGYKLEKFLVYVNKYKAGSFILSPFADKHYKPAYLFWSWTGIILAVPLPIALFFLTSWIYSLGSFILGLVIVNASRRSAAQFVLWNMLENEDFWEYVLLHNGAEIRDENNNEILSSWLKEMGKKHGSISNKYNQRK